MTLTSLFSLMLLVVCTRTPDPGPNNPPNGLVGEFAFEQLIIDNAGVAYERDVGDLDGDGHNDIVAISDNPPNLLYWFRYPDFTKATLVQLNQGIHGWPNFRADDVKLADFDNDGDLDVVTRIGDSGDINGKVVWFQNPRPAGGVDGTWTMHDIGVNYYVKDIVVADVDRDNKLDVITREHGGTQVWFQNGPDSWTKKSTPHPEHEGMDAGDLDGDGDVDIVLNGFWLETPAAPRTGTYLQHTIDAKWYNQSGNWQANNCKVVVADINGDSRNDVVLSHSELPSYPVSWYSAADPVNGPWIEHVIVSRLDYCHNLQAADFDLDGHMDALAGGMVQSPQKGLTVYLGDGGANWTAHTVQSLGSYSAELGDIDDDGDLDIIGIRQYDQTPTEIWRNLVRSACQDGGWEYIQVDSSRSKWGNYEPPSWLAYFGLGWGDVTGDGYLDIVSGRYCYRNPGGDMTGAWVRSDLGLNVDGLAIVDVDGDAFGDVIGTRGATVYWLEANDVQGTTWTARVIDTTAPTENHVNPQGYMIADVVPGGRPEIILSNGGQVFYYTIPAANPEAGSWPRTMVVDESNSEGIGIADIDRDGLLDIAMAHFPAGSGDTGPRQIKWARNPGDGSGNWAEYIIGSFPGAWPDRVAADDLNGDNRADIVVTEETSDNNASTYWFEAPVDPTQGNWTRRLIVTQYTTNSMDVADIDRDGDNDIILCEHRSANSNEKLAIWVNDGNGNFTEDIIDQGKEGHLGARVADLDGDGDLEIMNIAFDEYQYLHLWRNDSCDGGAANRAPNVNGGPDQAIALSDLATLGGTVTDDGLPNPPGAVTITWSKVSGPGTVNFTNPAAASTTASFSAAGTYILRLEAFDGELTASDDVTVTVSTQPVNQPPVVDAGPDQSVTLPSLATLTGNVGDDGLPNPPGALTISWSKVSGPGTVGFTDPTAASTTAQISAAGTYILRLQAFDGELTTSDDVTVTASAQTINQPPVVDAGPDQNVTLPSLALLSGAVSDDGLPDPPGALTISWSKVSGPGPVTFGSPSAAVTTAQFGGSGTFILELSGYDGEYITADQVIVTVLSNPNNEAPVVEIDPVPSYVIVPQEAVLRAAVSDDGVPNPPGALSLAWRKINGPGNVFFSPPDAVVTSARFTRGGEYVLRLDAYDGDLVGSGEVAVRVVGSTRRVRQDITVLYTFDEGDGRFIYDVAGLTEQVNLTISDEQNVTWSAGALTLDTPTTIFSPFSASKIHDAVTAEHQLTVEAWMRPSVAAPGEPASVVLLPVSSGARNFELEQASAGAADQGLVDARLRTTATNEQGEPGVATSPGTISSELMHVVYTWDEAGTARIYVNGVEQIGEVIGGDLSNWEANATLFVANNVDGSKPWLGTLHLIAMYARALSPVEITQNYLAGPDPPTGALTDLDGDGDVDHDDLQFLLDCTSGPALPYAVDALPPGCTFVPDSVGVIQPDFDRDRDVDVTDFGIFQRCLTGPGWPADPFCGE